MVILLVENDGAVVRIWTRWFSRDNEVMVAESADRAIQLINQRVPDIILLDLRLNGPEEKDSGIAVYRHIRETLGEEIPIIFITGLEYNVDLFTKASNYASMDRDRGLNTTMLKKPLNIRELTAAVNAA